MPICITLPNMPDDVCKFFMAARKSPLCRSGHLSSTSTSSRGAPIAHISNRAPPSQPPGDFHEIQDESEPESDPESVQILENELIGDPSISHPSGLPCKKLKGCDGQSMLVVVSKEVNAKMQDNLKRKYIKVQHLVIIN